MNENIDLTKILKDCPKGTKLYSINYGDVEFEKINEGYCFPILVRAKNNSTASFLADGKLFPNYNGECTLFPSKEQRDWSKFEIPQCKKERFDPKTLKAFDKVLVKDSRNDIWYCKFFSHIMKVPKLYNYATTAGFYKYCIPYNDDTKHLVGTNEDAPEYYRYWED